MVPNVAQDETAGCVILGDSGTADRGPATWKGPTRYGIVVMEALTIVQLSSRKD